MLIWVHVLHALLLLLTGWLAVSLGALDDLTFLLSPRESRTMLVVETRGVFSQGTGTQYYEVTVKPETGEPFVLDAHIPKTVYSAPPLAETTIVVRCVVGAKSWCRPPGWYHSVWRVLWKFGGVMWTLWHAFRTRSRFRRRGGRFLWRDLYE